MWDVEGSYLALQDTEASHVGAFLFSAPGSPRNVVDTATHTKTRLKKNRLNSAVSRLPEDVIAGICKGVKWASKHYDTHLFCLKVPISPETRAALRYILGKAEDNLMATYMDSSGRPKAYQWRLNKREWMKVWAHKGVRDISEEGT